MRFFIDETDQRNVYCGELLKENGFDVCALGKTSDVPLRGDILLFSPAKRFEEPEILALPEEITLICGNINEMYAKTLEDKKIKHINLLADEKFAIKNANLTAEGVLAIILEKYRKSIYDASYMILGGGRIAKALAILFSKLGLRFSIVTFNPKKYPEYFLYTNNVFFKTEFVEKLGEYQIIINTIPSRIIDDEIMKKIPCDTMMIETASVDCLDKTKVENFDFIPAPALPKKYSCESAGRVVFETIMEAIYDRK